MNRKMCVRQEASVRQAMLAIEAGEIGLAFVTTGDDVLLGVVSDGDVRRFLLQGGTLDASVTNCMERSVRTVNASVSRNDVLDLMQSCWLEQIPIVDKDRRLIGVHLLHEMLGRVHRPNWAVIMAGGRGSRLAPLTDDTPKPMLTVAGRPILERLVLHIVSFGIQRVFISVNFLSEQIKEHFGDGGRYGCRIDYLQESKNEPLGTAGSLSLLPESPSHPVLVMNGDLVTQVEVGQLLESHERSDHYATIGIRPYVQQIPFGCVTVQDGCVTSFEEKPRNVFSISAGVAVLSTSAVADVPNRFFPVTELFEKAFKEGKTIGSFLIEGEWADVGRIGEFRRANGFER